MKNRDGVIGHGDGGSIFIFHVCHELGEAGGNVTAHFFDDLFSFSGDANHDLAAIFRSVNALDESKLLKAINQASGGSGGVAHLFGNL